jgi:hypothetical protein
MRPRSTIAAMLDTQTEIYESGRFWEGEAAHER